MNKDKSVANWLFLCCLMIFAMVVIGGLTRLTGSGLSMVKWSPLLGWLPPMDETTWQQVFDYYKTSPEFQKINWEMDLEGFKGIFWLEYIHRLMGRLVGVVFLLPFFYFLVKKRLGGSLKPKLITMFILGGLQGGMGWYMVKSGLMDSPHVSQYRLTVHLGFAFVIFAYMFWVALGLYFGERAETRANLKGFRGYVIGVTGLIFLTVLSGGFVAGLDAGLAFNTFPLMNGRWIPGDYLLLQPAWLNPFENLAAVQWDHRFLALLTLLNVLFIWLIAFKGKERPVGEPVDVESLTGTWKKNTILFIKLIGVLFLWMLPFVEHIRPRTLRAINLLLGMVVVQIGLGVATLLYFVPVSLASIHQAGAMVLFTLALFVTHQLRHEPHPDD